MMGGLGKDDAGRGGAWEAPGAPVVRMPAVWMPMSWAPRVWWAPMRTALGAPILVLVQGPTREQAWEIVGPGTRNPAVVTERPAVGLQGQESPGAIWALGSQILALELVRWERREHLQGKRRLGGHRRQLENRVREPGVRTGDTRRERWFRRRPHVGR